MYSLHSQNASHNPLIKRFIMSHLKDSSSFFKLHYCHFHLKIKFKWIKDLSFKAKALKLPQTQREPYQGRKGPSEYDFLCTEVKIKNDLNIVRQFVKKRRPCI